MSRCIFVLAVVVSGAAAEGAVFKVGPHGTYATVQAGLDAAAGVAGAHEVRIESGVYGDPVAIYGCCAGRIVASGGWNDTFTSATGSGATVLDGSGLGQVVHLDVTHGELSLRNLTIRNGYLETVPHAVGSTFGAGLEARVRGDGKVELSGVSILDNRIHAAILEESSAIGAGAAIDVFEGGQVRMWGNVFAGNAITEGAGARLVASYGAGAWVGLRDGSGLDMRRNTLRNNLLEGAGWVGGAGLHVQARSTALVGQVSENLFDRNVVLVSPPEAPVSSGMTVEATGNTTRFQARRNRFFGNRGSSQLHLTAYGGAAILAGDSVLARGTHDGVRAASGVGSRVFIVNLTSTGNGNAGVRMSGSGFVFNTIAFGNAPEVVFGPAVATGANLFGVNPLFEPGSVYKLSASSPARDIGSATPPGGLGPLDVDLRPRVFGPRVDIGAYEWRE